MTDHTPLEPAVSDEVPTAVPAPDSRKPRYPRKTVLLIAGLTAAGLVLGGGGVAAGTVITTSLVRSAFGNGGDESRPDPIDRRGDDSGPGGPRGQDRERADPGSANPNPESVDPESVDPSPDPESVHPSPAPEGTDPSPQPE